MSTEVGVGDGLTSVRSRHGVGYRAANCVTVDLLRLQALAFSSTKRKQDLLVICMLNFSDA